MPDTCCRYSQGVQILLLGGSGFIGARLADRLLHAGHRVEAPGRASLELSRMTRPGSWRPHLNGVHVVVNAAGILRGNFRAVHESGPQALFEACESMGVRKVV